MCSPLYGHQFALVTTLGLVPIKVTVSISSDELQIISVRYTVAVGNISRNGSNNQKHLPNSDSPHGFLNQM